MPPLEPEQDVALDLGTCAAAVYERGGYASQIECHRPPPGPPLSEQELAWMAGILETGRPGQAW